MFIVSWIRRLAKKVAQLVSGVASHQIATPAHVDLLGQFPLYVAHGWGAHDARTRLTVQSINAVFPALSRLATLAPSKHRHAEFADELQTMIATRSELAEILGRAFRTFGSDKSTIHDYHKLYAPIASQFGAPNIFEIGLGTPHLDIVSTMGKAGHPGGSLRAFRSCFPDRRLYGADYDRRILFQEDRIETFFVDQTRLETFQELPTSNMQFDLMIDDGLHSPDANLHSLEFPAEAEDWWLRSN